MSAQESIVVRCPHCRTKNRVDLHKAARALTKCARCGQPITLPEAQSGPTEVTDATFAELVERAPVPVFLEFYSPYCIHCQRLDPAMERFARESGRRLRVAKLNIDTNRYTAAQFQVQGTPTFLLLDNGTVLDRIPGAIPEDQLRYRLHRFLS